MFWNKRKENPPEAPEESRYSPAPLDKKSEEYHEGLRAYREYQTEFPRYQNSDLAEQYEAMKALNSRYGGIVSGVEDEFNSVKRAYEKVRWQEYYDQKNARTDEENLVELNKFMKEFGEQEYQQSEKRLLENATRRAIENSFNYSEVSAMRARRPKNLFIAKRQYLKFKELYTSLKKSDNTMIHRSGQSNRLKRALRHIADQLVIAGSHYCISAISGGEEEHAKQEAIFLLNEKNNDKQPIVSGSNEDVFKDCLKS